MSQNKLILKNSSPQEVKNLLQELNEPSYRADQILDWAYKKKVQSFDEMTNLPTLLREKLKGKMRLMTLDITKKLVSPKDGTTKYLFKTLDEEYIECAVMKQDYGNTVCVSSQIGCGLACSFCSSTIGGMVRNLTPGEMIDEVILAEKNLDSSTGEEERIKNIVVMGMGEPLYNYSNLIRFLKTANDPKGLNTSFRNITVSTAGIIPKIFALAEEKLPITLAISLHAPDNATRSQLMPINKKYPIENLLEACKAYIEKTGRRITFEYILIKSVNDSNNRAKELARLVKGLLCHINLIPINPAGNKTLQKPGGKKINDFYKIIAENNISVSIRKERGEDIDGACGQLRRRANAKL